MGGVTAGAVEARAAGRGRAGGLGPAMRAARGRLALVALLLGLAAVGWWISAGHMQGMDEGPGTALGSLGSFLGVWLVMMAAMMLPAVSPTVALYARMAHGRWAGGPLVFVGGYLLAWGAIGVAAYGVFEMGRVLLGDQLAWDAGGRWLAGGVLVLAAVYELTPLKDACLAKCRSPLGFLLGSWRDGPRGALQMGARHGAWCVGCCWALMASLFALGVMSITWMAIVAALITLEKTLPGGRFVTYGVAGVLLALGILIMADPAAVPGLTVPGQDPMPMSMSMSAG